MAKITTEQKKLLVSMLDLINYAHFIGDTMENQFIEFCHGPELDQALAVVLDALGVPADDYDHEADTGYSRDWLNNEWFDWEFENEAFIDFLIAELEK